MNKQELIERISNTKGYTSFQGETIVKKQVLNLIGELDEPKKVVVPQFVAEHIEYLRGLNSPMRDLFSIDWIDSNELAQWLYNEPGADDTLARAWLDGYAVEREKVYTVKIPNPHHDGITVLEKVGDDVIMSQMDDYLAKWQEEPEYQLTAAEIRKDFEWAWQAGFAKEVE